MFIENMLEIKKEGTFHGQDYLVKIKAETDTLKIELESKYEALWWSNQFSLGYIEELTLKTDQPLKYEQFLKVLSASLDNSEKGYFDILTLQDLQQMRKNNNQRNQDSIHEAANTINNNDSGSQNLNNENIKTKKKEKRYIIIISQSKNKEIIHYPLCLNSNNNEDVSLLKEKMKIIKAEVERLKSADTIRQMSLTQKEEPSKNEDESFNLYDDPVLDQLKRENELLKTKIKRVEESSQITKDINDVDKLAKNKINLEIELELIKSRGKREIEELNNQIAEKQVQIVETKFDMLKLQKEAALKTQQLLSKSEELQDDSKTLPERIVKSTENAVEVMMSQIKTLSEQGKQLQRSQTEVEYLKMVDEKQKFRLKQLEVEVDSAIKRIASSSNRSERMFTPYQRKISINSPAQKNNRYVSPKQNINHSQNKRASSLPIKSYSPLPRNFQQQPFKNQLIWDPEQNKNKDLLALNGVKSKINSYNQYIQSKKNISNRSPLDQKNFLTLKDTINVEKQQQNNIFNNKIRVSPSYRQQNRAQTSKTYSQTINPDSKTSPSNRYLYQQPLNIARGNGSPSNRIEKNSDMMLKRKDHIQNNKRQFNYNKADLKDLDLGMNKLENLLKLAKN